MADRPPLESFLEQPQRPPLESFVEAPASAPAEAGPPAGRPEPAPGESWGDIGKDVVLSTTIGGIPKGIIGLAGLPEQVAGWTASGLGYLTGRDPESFRDQGDMRLPTTQQIRGGVENVTGPLYEPRTTYGQYGQTVGEFLPAAVGGPIGIGRRLITQALVPGIASEAAGQWTAGGEFEPYARAGAGFLAGMRGARSAEHAAVEATKRQLLDVEIPAGTKGLYKQFDQAADGVPVPLRTRIDLPQQMGNDLLANRQFEFNAKPAYDAIKDLAKVNDVPSLAAWRQSMREELYSKGYPIAAKTLTDRVDQAIEQSMPAGRPGIDFLRTADREYSIRKLIENLDKRFAKVEGQTAATHSGTNLDNKYRQALVKFQDDQRAWAGLTPQEQVRAQNIINGGLDVNSLRRLSNVLGGGGGLGHAAGIVLGEALFGHAGAITAGVAAPVTKALENRLTRQRAQDLLASVAERSAFRNTVGPLSAPPLITQLGRTVPFALAPMTTPEGYPYYQQQP